MTAVVDRVACPECGAYTGNPCVERWNRVWFLPEPHQARREAYWQSRRPVADTVAEAEEK